MTSRPNKAVAELCALSQAALEQRYLAAPAGDIPNGDSAGTPVFLPGTTIGRMVSGIGGMAWKGKVFTRTSSTSATLVNKILGLRFGKAKVFPGQSCMDQRPTVVIEYWGSSLLFFWTHDEIRKVDEDNTSVTYLGRAYLRLLPGVHVFGTWFILNFSKTARSA